MELPPSESSGRGHDTSESLSTLEPISSNKTGLQKGTQYESFVLRKPAALAMVGTIVFVGIAVIVMMIVINDTYQGVGELYVIKV